MKCFCYICIRTLSDLWAHVKYISEQSCEYLGGGGFGQSIEISHLTRLCRSQIRNGKPGILLSCAWAMAEADHPGGRVMGSAGTHQQTQALANRPRNAAIESGVRLGTLGRFLIGVQLDGYGLFRLTLVRALADTTGGSIICRPRCHRVSAMFSRLPSNLTLALCLALQAAALLCLTCPCRPNAEERVAAAVSTRTGDTRGTGCCLCQASSEARLSCRPPHSERQVRMLAVTAPDVSVPDDRVFVQTASRLAKTAFPSSDLAELQVFLE